MATIRKKGDRWQVQVRRKGVPSVTRSFLSRADAQAWARQREIEIDRIGLPANRRELDRITVADVLIRYRNEIIPKKRGWYREGMAVKMLLNHKIANLPLSMITHAHASSYRDERLRTIKPSSINRELDIYRHAFEVARKDWAIPLTANPFAEVARAKGATSRSRRLEPGEWERLARACRQCRNPFVGDVVEFALETAMRYGEIINVRWTDVNLKTRTLHIPLTKNGHPRTIPLSYRAITILERLVASKQHDNQQVFQVTYHSAKMAWRRIQKRANLKDFHFHDLRHEAISRFFEHGLSIPEVAMISGHRDPRMLFRYTHPKPELVAKKLAKATVG